MSHKLKVEKARKRKDKFTDEIFALAPTPQTRFQECLALAPADLRAAYQAALIDAEHAAVAAGKAWFASFGMLTFYR
jgi:hypothetical protein